MSPLQPTLENRTAQMLQEAQRHTTEIALTQDNPAVDAHLLHLWDSRSFHPRRWKRKTNRKLKIRIAQITVQAEQYARELSQENWLHLCNRLQGTLSIRCTWHLLRSLMGARESKSATAQQIRKLIHNYPGTEQELLVKLQASLAADPTTPAVGLLIPNLTNPFTQAEIEAAVYNFTRNTAR